VQTCFRKANFLTSRVIGSTLARKMGVTERIKQILSEREQKAAEAERALLANSNKTHQEELASQALQRQKQEAQENFVSTQTEKVFKESSLLQCLQEINQEILGNVKKYISDSDKPYKHELVPDFKKGTLTLIWGRGFYIRDNEISFDRFYSVSYIKAVVDPDTETLTINKQNIPIKYDDGRYWSESNKIDGAGASFVFTKNEWRNQETIDSAVTQSFLNPTWSERRYSEPHGPPEGPGIS